MRKKLEMKSKQSVANKAAVCALAIAFAQVVFPQMLPVSIPAGQSAPVVSITMTRNGPTPRRLIVAPGPFVLAIHTHWMAMSDTFSLVLKTPTSTNTAADPLITFLPQDHKNVDYQLVSLQTGSYELQFSNHPDWSVSLEAQ